MKSLIALSLAFSILTGIHAQAKKPGTFISGKNAFLLNGEPYVIRAAEIHYPRIPREYWEHRIQMCKAMGMNTICIYLFWNLHEQEPDQFDFTGQKDVAEFVRLVQKNGMYCIVRPGPYVCAEWDMGGLPWWLLKKKDIRVRTKDDAYFMKRTKKYLQEVGKQLAPYQIQNGGNIIMVQVENEYAVWGRDGEYMAEVRDALRDAGFDKVQLFRCDWNSNFDQYQLDDVAIALNFGSGSNVDDKFKGFKKKHPDSPLMCSEYWSGWFDHWGKPHETRSVESLIGSMKQMMDKEVSFSLYMAHGGTSFGPWGGANSPPYSPMVTSYDYNAPIDEAGNTTEKFFAVRDLMEKHLQKGESLGKIPDPIKQIEIPSFELNESASLFDNLPAPIKSTYIQPMEMFDQGWGRILYRTTLSPSASEANLVISDIHDWAIIFIDEKEVGRLQRNGTKTLTLPAISKEVQLDILVEATGRVNYGKELIDRKGITQKVELETKSSTSALKDWLVYNFPVDYEFQKNKKFTQQKTNGPAWYRSTFNLKENGDTYLDMSSWGKGMVWVNGHNIGRFWEIGPQQTLFMPGCWLKKGENEIIVLDLDTPESTTITGLAAPILNELKLDWSLLHRKEGEQLDLSKESPDKTGTLSDQADWQEQRLDAPKKGRYFCLEALSAQRKNDPFTAIAELEIIGKDGKPVNRQNWNVVYADQEEIFAANQTADLVFDKQESTFWHTSWSASKPPLPHQIVIDMGKEITITGFRYLPRTDNNTNGMIKEYRFYIKSNPFIY